MMINNRHFYNFPRITVAVYFRVLQCIEILAEQVVRFKTFVFGSIELLRTFIKANGRVGAIPTY